MKSSRPSGKTHSAGEVRVPPQNLEAEQYVLGAMMQSRDAVESCLLILKREDFYRENFRVIYGTIADLYADGLPIEMQSVGSLLQRDETLERIGGYSALSELVMNCPAPANAEFYANVVKEMSERRKLIRILSQKMTSIYDLSEDYAKHRGELLDLVSGYTEAGMDFDCEPGALSLQVFSKLKDTTEGRRTTHFKTGIDNFDKAFTGIEAENLSVISALPKVGKSNFMIDAASNLADSGIPVGYVALDIHRETVLSRLLSYRLNIPGYVLWGAGAPLDGVKDELKKIERLPLRIAGEENVSRDPYKIIQWIIFATKKYGLKVVFIDSFTMLEVGFEKGRSEENAISNVVNAFQSISKRMGVAVMGAVDQNYEGNEKGSSRWRAGASNIINFELSEDRKILKVKSKYIRNGPPAACVLYPYYETSCLKSCVMRGDMTRREVPEEEAGS